MRKPNRFEVSLCMIMAASAATVAPARQASPPEADGAVLQDIVVTARRVSESMQDVPIAVTAISSDRIAALTMRDLMDVRKLAPGLYMSSQGSGGRVKIAIRGQSEADSRLTTDPSVGVYVDGVNYPRVYGLRSSFVDIAQVEVLRGPQGTLFGKNTTGGALNITTNQPEFERGGYVDVLYGNYNSAQITAAANLPLTDDTVALRVVGQKISRDGFGSDGNGDDIADDDVTSARATLRVVPADGVDIRIAADFVRQRNAGPTMQLSRDTMLQTANSATAALGAVAAQLGLAPASAAARLTAYNAWRAAYDASRSGKFHDFAGTSGQVDEVDLSGASATVSVDLGALELKSITSFRKLDRKQIQDLDLTPFNLLTINVTTEQENFSQELQVAATDGEGLDWQAGLYYSRETGTEFSGNNSSRPVRADRASVSDSDVTNVSRAAYLQGTYEFSPQLRLTAGLRYTEDERSLTSRNRRDPLFATPYPALPPLPGQCFLLSPALGGPVYPDCVYKAPKASFDDLSYLVSADWRPSETVMLYASRSRGYRSGGFTAQSPAAVVSSVSALQAAFTPYEPEYVDNTEIGLKSDWLDRRLRINAAAFHQDYQDVQAQIRDFVNGAPVTLIRNAAQATLYGAEIEVAAVPVPELELYLSAAYVNAKYDVFLARDASNNLVDLSGSKFTVPETTANVGGTLRIPSPIGDLRLNLNYAWVGDVVFRADSTAPESVGQSAYGLLDARLGWQSTDSGLSVSLFAKNLTNEEYFIAATNLESSGWNLRFIGDPRVYGLQIRKDF